MSLSTEITDGTILLRPFRLDDTAQVYEAVHESLTDLKPWMSWAYDAYSQQDAEDFIRITRARWEESSLFAFAITDARSGEILGGCSLSHIHPIYHYCNLGYWVRTLRHGAGIAGQAAKLASLYGFEHGRIIRAEIVVAMGNQRSIRVAEKVGAHYEGILFNRMVVGRAIYDAHMFSLIPQDFGMAARL
jgi:RimJ/RimL family protein N-acetyltransferase